MSLTEKQKAARENRVGSSDAGVIAGVDERKSVLELFYQFTGKLARYTDEETRYQKIGSMLEAPIGHLAAEELGLKIRRVPPRIHPRHAFMSCNLDFGIVNHPKGPGTYEVKNRAGQRAWDTLPDDILIQKIHQMAVMGWDWGIVVGLFQFGEIKHYEVERDKEMEEYLIEIESRFMLRVQTGVPPDEAWTSANIGILTRLYPQDDGQTITLPEQGRIMASQFYAAKVRLEEVKRDQAEAEGYLKSMIGGASVADIPDWGMITWRKTKDGKKFDEAQFAKDHPDLYAQYHVPNPGHRVFLAKPNKEVQCQTKSFPPMEPPAILPSPTSSAPSLSPSSPPTPLQPN